MITTNKTIEKLVGDNPFFISYFKKDGTIKAMKKAYLDLTGRKSKNPNIGKTQIIVYEYKTVNIDDIVVMGNKDVYLADSKHKELLDEDRAYKEDEWRIVKENGSSTVTTRI
tara:strand:- start:153 stop:488 length:336 start_codon:yes stop_codon:yes gene_type:complete